VTLPPILAGACAIAMMWSAHAAIGRAEPQDAPPAHAGKPAHAVQPARAAIAQISWMAGVWIGTVGASTAEERWTPAAGGAMLGVTRTLRGEKMTGFEFLRISERDGGLVYAAMPNGRSPATEFLLTHIDARSATFENPAHDFPKKIRYSIAEDGALEAVVSGDAASRPVTFRFTRQDAPGTRW
jgi:hypothetical protein